MAEADGISPLDGGAAEASRDSILPVNITDLGDEIWRLDCSGPDGKPVLELNKNIETISQIALGDDNFFALVYPAVIRQVLHRILRVEKMADLDGPTEDWRVQWLKFACALPGVFPPPTSEDDSDEDSVAEDQLDWIEETAAAFCTQHQVLQRFNQINSNRGE